MQSTLSFLDLIILSQFDINLRADCNFNAVDLIILRYTLDIEKSYLIMGYILNGVNS